MKLEVQQPRNHRQTRLPVNKQDIDHRERGGGISILLFPSKGQAITTAL